jgi:3-oxoacyl-[acyl-carrier-protein] synthase III
MAVPERRVTNDELATMVDTSDEWIRSRTGIGARHIAGEHETTATLGATAAREALASAGRDPGTIDLIICATTTPDYYMPATACVIQHELGATRAAAFDLAAACSGFVYALATGSQFIAAGVYRRVLVIGADTLTRTLDWTDRRTCVLFGDGAGAVVLEASEEPAGLLSLELGSDGAGGGQLCVPASRVRQPLDGGQEPDTPFLTMNGREIYRFGVRIMVEATRRVVEQAGLGLDKVDLLVPHQANQRIID